MRDVAAPSTPIESPRTGDRDRHPRTTTWPLRGQLHRRCRAWRRARRRARRHGRWCSNTPSRCSLRRSTSWDGEHTDLFGSWTQRRLVRPCRTGRCRSTERPHLGYAGVYSSFLRSREGSDLRLDAVPSSSKSAAAGWWAPGDMIVDVALDLAAEAMRSRAAHDHGSATDAADRP